MINICCHAARAVAGDLCLAAVGVEARQGEIRIGACLPGSARQDFAIGLDGNGVHLVGAGADGRGQHAGSGAAGRTKRVDQIAEAGVQAAVGVVACQGEIFV